MSVCVLHFCKKCLKGFLFLNYLSSFLPMQDFNKSWNIYYTQTFFCILFYIWKSEMDHKLVFFIALNDVLLSLFCFVLFLHKEMHLPCQDFILSTSTAFLKGWVWIKGKKKKKKNKGGQGEEGRQRGQISRIIHSCTKYFEGSASCWTWLNFRFNKFSLKKRAYCIICEMII